MKLSELKTILEGVQELNFRLPNGNYVPQHFHVTEVGQVNKHFIDCGGTVRNEKTVSFQLWEANDLDHRLAPKKLTDIISLSERVLGVEDGEIEVEYQSDTIGKYGLGFNGRDLVLTQKLTACLAEDQCGVSEKPKVKLSELQNMNNSCCGPNSKCC
jgi:hypothetical protein